MKNSLHKIILHGKLLFLSILLLVVACKKDNKTSNNSNNIKIYSGYGVVGQTAGGCTKIIKLYQGYENIIILFRNDVLMDSSVTSTRNDTIYGRWGLPGEMSLGDSIYFEYRVEYNLSRCFGTGMDIYPPNVFVTKISILK
ncbi:MAG: hypothetical protein Q8M15_13005 [Bacteroidota bacterium]|nr:hypothetical protein [Bacteroidota bacterium]